MLLNLVRWITNHTTFAIREMNIWFHMHLVSLLTLSSVGQNHR